VLLRRLSSSNWEQSQSVDYGPECNRLQELLMIGLAKKLIAATARRFGYAIVRKESVRKDLEARKFSGHYSSTSTSRTGVRCEPGAPKPYAGSPVVFIVGEGATEFRQEILYSSLTLLKLIEHFEFETVLDIGSHAGNCVNLFRRIGKRPTTCELSPGYAADFKQDFLKIQFPEQFDAIWCSQVLEHQRNVGLFVDKLFDDLKEGGVLALTVPLDSGTALDFGHCNKFFPLLLIYHLVMAGFDCRDVFMCCYDGMIGVVLRKKSNGIVRHLANATLPNSEATEGELTINGVTYCIRTLLGDEVFDGMTSSLPKEIVVKHNRVEWTATSYNWGDPI